MSSGGIALGVLLRVSLALVLAACAAHEPAAHLATAQTLKGQVVGVHDGDTITVLTDQKSQHKIRLKGIDAPELAQPLGEKSKHNLSTLIFKRSITVEFTKRDRYRRIVGVVLRDGEDVCLQQVEDGYAWHYKQYQQEQTPAERQTYDAAQAAAQAQRRGIWQDPAPVPPWEFRRQRRQASLRR